MVKALFSKYLAYFSSFVMAIFLYSQVSGQNVIFPDSIRYCNADSILLDAGQGFNGYLWSNGDTTSTSWVYENGDYWVSLNQGDTLILEENFYVVLIPAGIVQDDAGIACGDTLLLGGSTGIYDYIWNPGGVTSDSIIAWPRDTTMYYATIIDPDTTYHYCVDSVLVTVEPVISVDTTIQFSIGCPGENKAQIQLGVSGGWPPYEYDWPPEAIPLFEDPSYAIGLSDGTKVTTITDTVGCFLDHQFLVKAHRLPELDLSSIPEEEAYLQNPYVTFSYENPLYDSLGVDTFFVSWWEWNFGDSATSTVLSPTHIYQTDGDYSVILEFKTFFECEGTDTLQFKINPVNLNVPNVITPNGDGINDLFEIWEGSAGGDDGNNDTKSLFQDDNDGPINLRDYYLSNSLTIFNRWGEKVYETDNYQNDWEGDGLNDGTYFYILKCVGEHRTDVFKGTLTILNDY